jgi:hypothetical protein
VRDTRDSMLAGTRRYARLRWATVGLRPACDTLCIAGERRRRFRYPLFKHEYYHTQERSSYTPSTQWSDPTWVLTVNIFARQFENCWNRYCFLLPFSPNCQIPSLLYGAGPFATAHRCLMLVIVFRNHGGSIDGERNEC